MTGLAVFTKIEEINSMKTRSARGILVSLSTSYQKKARGVITGFGEAADIPTEPGVYNDVQVLR